MPQGAVKGFNDIFPASPEPFLRGGLWQHVLSTASEVLTAYGYAPTWFPLVEYAELFSRGLGTDTDVVSKEMYAFRDRGERQLALRPEGTAGAARAYIEHHLGRNEPQQKWFYWGPMFRAERPQKGRYRQFYQLGAECFGARGPVADIEVLQMLAALCRALGLPPLLTRVNTLGDRESRQAYVASLGTFLGRHREALCVHCQRRAEHNPLRTLDCKEPTCKSVVAAAPDIIASLSAASRQWFHRYERLLGAANLSVERSPSLVRGLDYYSEAIFELCTPALGSQDAVFGGGRYDGLVELLGGPPTPAVGFAAGLERVALLLEGDAVQDAGRPDLALLSVDEGVQGRVLALAEQLRSLPMPAGSRRLRVLVEADGGKLGRAFRRAERAGARFALAVGDRECETGEGSLKRMEDGQASPVRLQAEALAAQLRL